MGLLDTLSYIGEAFDKPGRAVRGLLGGRPEELLAAVPFSDSVGLTDKANRVSGQDLTGLDDGGVMSTVANIGTEVATDPLLFAGGLLGRLAGAKASEAAVARGPQYGTTTDDLLRMGREGGEEAEQAARIMTDFLDPKDLSRALGELPPNATVLGHGQEAMAFRSPTGEVIRIGDRGAASGGRPVAEGVLQPTSAIDSGAVRVERLPFAENVGDAGIWQTRNPQTMTTQMDDLDRTLRQSGLKFDDRHLGNVGVVGGKPAVIDPGALDMSGFSGSMSPVTQAGDPSRLMNLLLDSVGANDAVRKAYATGLSGPDMRGKIGAYGAGLGGGTGILARLMGE
jgi:hypothetical protein